MEDKIFRSLNLRLANMYSELGEANPDGPHYFNIADLYLFYAELEGEDTAEVSVRLQEAMIRSRHNGNYKIDSKVNVDEARIKAKLNGDDVEARVALDEQRIRSPFWIVKK